MRQPVLELPELLESLVRPVVSTMPLLAPSVETSPPSLVASLALSTMPLLAASSLPPVVEVVSLEPPSSSDDVGAESVVLMVAVAVESVMPLVPVPLGDDALSSSGARPI